mgnify:CR=1 FL=1
MKKEIKSVLKKLAGEAPEFHECFKKLFVYDEWINGRIFVDTS